MNKPYLLTRIIGSDEILQKISSILECNGYVIDGFLDSMQHMHRKNFTLQW